MSYPIERVAYNNARSLQNTNKDKLSKHSCYRIIKTLSTQKKRKEEIQKKIKTKRENGK